MWLMEVENTLAKLFFLMSKKLFNMLSHYCMVQLKVIHVS